MASDVPYVALRWGSQEQRYRLYGFLPLYQSAVTSEIVEHSKLESTRENSDIIASYTTLVFLV